MTRKKMPKVVATAFWRRMDAPGHDTCRLEQSDAGWHLHGTAVFREGAMPARLTYIVTCDPAWLTLEGEVRGSLGTRSIESTIARTSEGEWSLDGSIVPGLRHLVDVDFGFTPATNLLQIRRLTLPMGQSVDAPVAWFDVAKGTLLALPQRYERRGETTFWYEAPTVDYAGLLEVTASGFIRRYPGLWEMEP